MSALIRPFAVPDAPAPLRMVRGIDSAVFDGNGRRYINAAAGLWNVTLGWGHERLLAAIKAQLADMAYCPLFDTTHGPAEQLAERLIALTDGTMAHAYLSTTGSAAVEAALRLARLHARANARDDATGIVAYDTGYHGSSWLAAGVSGLMSDELKRFEGRPAIADFVPAPTDEARTLDAIATLFAKRSDHISCLLIEPVLGSAGVLIPSCDYGEKLTALCQTHQVLLIADEVATGLGRCGASFAAGLVGLLPDLICLSKGLSAGYVPIGATLVASHVTGPLHAAGIPMTFGSTQDGNPLGCAAALATLDVIAMDGLTARANTLGPHIAAALRGCAAVVSDVRSLGLMIGIDLRHANGVRFREDEAAQARARCQDEGLLVYHFDGGLSLFPPLTLSDDDAEDMIDILTETLCQLH